MSLILCIETSTTVCSVALALNGETVVSKIINRPNAHSTELTVLIEDIFKEHPKYKMTQLDAVAISEGPGSYTGLRIGVSVAKGLCYGLQKPLIAIPSLLNLSVGALKLMNQSASSFPILLCPMIDARRMEVYTALYRPDLSVWQETAAKIIDQVSFQELLEENQIYFFGNGAAKCQDVINHTNASFIVDVEAIAENMSQLAHQAFEEQKFKDVAYFEPFYLKDFMVTTPKNRVI